MICSSSKSLFSLLGAALLLCTGFIFPHPTQAEESLTGPLVKVDASISPAEITIGDLSTFSVKITHDKNIQIYPPVLTGDFSGFELVDQGTSPEKHKNGKIEQEYWYRLRGDLVGVHAIPGPKIKFESLTGDLPDGSSSNEVVATETKAVIRSVLYQDGEPQDIRTIKPIVGAFWPWKKYLFPALAFIALACLIGYSASWWVKRNRIKPVAPAPPPVTADELALRELQHLYDKGYHLKNQIRELYFEFSEIFRRYLGNRYHIPALDWTTEEIRRSLSTHPDVDDTLLEEAVQVLTNSDLVKFAKFQVDPDTAIRLMKSARTFIQQTAKSKTKPTISDSEPVVTAP